MRALRQNRLIAAFAVAAIGLSSSMASAQSMDPQPQPQTSPGDVPQPTATDAVQPPAPAQPAQAEPPPPIPVPPIEAPGGGFHIDSTVLLGLGAVILGAGAYFLLHKKKSTDGTGGTTTTP